MVSRIKNRFDYEFRKRFSSNKWYRDKILTPQILRKHKNIAKFWNNILIEYKKGQITKYSFKKKKKFKTNKIVWQFWAQGIESNELPQIVKMCFKSVDSFASDFEIIRLNMDNISDYIDLPDYVYEKLNTSNYNFTFFSDLLRVALLNTYGGVWIDATILLTDNLSNFKFIDDNFFVYERSRHPTNLEAKKMFEEINLDYWSWNEKFKVKLFNSFIISKPKNEIICSIQDLLLYYWAKNNSVKHYFIFQILYNELTDQNNLNVKNRLSDEIPHYLYLKIKRGHFNMSYEEIFECSILHKMTYFPEDEICKLEKELKKHIKYG